MADCALKFFQDSAIKCPFAAISRSSRSTQQVATATNDKSVVQNVELFSVAARPGQVALKCHFGMADRTAASWRGRVRPRGAGEHSGDAVEVRGVLERARRPERLAGPSRALRRASGRELRRLRLSACRGLATYCLKCVTTHFAVGCTRSAFRRAC